MDSIAILSMEGIQFLLRWLHFFFGVIWIGLLYYFNFVQGAFVAEADAPTKSQVTQKLLPRALWWFRWGAMYTFITGTLILLVRAHLGGWEIFSTSWGVSILTGASLATLMFLNVWLVIWPNQKVIIQSATQVAAGGQAMPEAATSATRALVASRTNTMFSIPMLFFMGAASHLTFTFGETFHGCILSGIIAFILVALEINALKGKTGPMATVKGVLTCGFVLTFILYTIVEIMT